MTIQTTQNTIPEYIDLEKWRVKGYEWQGDFNLSDFPRLAEQIHQVSASNPQLRISLNYEKNTLWFAFSIDTAVALDCQRCLSDMNFKFADDIRLAVLEEEVQANLLNDDADWILVDEVCERIASEIRLPIASVIEDELLLQIPASPKHDIGDEGCVPVEIIEEDEDDVEIQENPFAALADLKDQLNK